MAADASDDRRDEAIPASVPQMQQGEDDECEHDIVITSFGHKYGRLRDGVDCMFDVRDVPNPPRMLRRTHTGRSARLMKELAKVPQIEVIATHIHDHLVRIGAQKDPATSSSKRMCLVASIGCECGVHRSVAIAELVARELRSQHKLRVTGATETYIDMYWVVQAVACITLGADEDIWVLAKHAAAVAILTEATLSVRTGRYATMADESNLAHAIQDAQNDDSHASSFGRRCEGLLSALDEQELCPCCVTWVQQAGRNMQVAMAVARLGCLPGCRRTRSLLHTALATIPRPRSALGADPPCGP
eukprot:CAMPEP_0185186020 /NCGR_PEP_ID=MMETSP1140-20130426/3735_1 /TAXON_ID=298111 /ORGANISM="Pavlova sp., Strain CCMP459" /LENGTH=302 /DNA_ID=CAMNT_0027752271 /DNA_START=108 /DNA_END=1018 /DNA_ORIENTATION=+